MGKCKLSLCIVEALIYKLHAMFDLKAGVSESGFCHCVVSCIFTPHFLSSL